MGPAPHNSPDTVVVVLPSLGPMVPSALDGVPDGSPVVAVDGGIDHALALGLTVDLAVGDFDSVSDEGLALLEAAGTPIDRYPAAKDNSDFELGLAAAKATGARQIMVIGGRGGRLDHGLANLLVLAAPSLAPARVVAHLDGAVVTVIRDAATLWGAVGSLVSLLPAAGAARSVTTEGLLYPLCREELEPGSARGLSNVFVEPTARVTLTGGVLLAIQPNPSDVTEGAGTNRSGDAR